MAELTESIGKIFSPEELAVKLKTDLNEDPSMVKKDIKALQKWIKKQPHLAKTGKQGTVKLTKNH